MAKRGATKELTHDNWAEEEEPEEMGTFKQASSQQLAARQIKRARRRGALDNSPPPGVFKGLAPFSGFGGTKDATSSQPSFSFLAKENVGEVVDKPSFSFFTKTNTNNDKTSDTTKSDIASPGKKTSTQPFQLSPECVSVSSKMFDNPIKTNGLGPNKPSTGAAGSKQFLAHLKSLNEGVLSWVKQHLDKNPHIDLSPVFDDYKKHFEELTKKYPAVSKSEHDTDMKTSDTKKDKASEKENKPLIGEQVSKTSPTIPTFSFGGASATSTKSSDTRTFTGFGGDSKVTERKEDSKDSNDKPMFTFGGVESKSSEGLLFGSGGKSSSGFNFGDVGSASSGTSKGLIFGNTNTVAVSGGSSEGATKADELSDEPSVVEVKEVKEDDALYEKKCKLFYMKEGSYVEKGVGTLFLKPAGEKTQLVVRALTNLGNILLNILLTTSIPTIRAGKNGVMIACVPNPPLDAKDPSNEPVKMLIRVKTSEDADNLLEKINEFKK